MQPEVINYRENNNLTFFANELLYGTLSNIITSWRIIPLTNISIREFESQILNATFLQFFDWVSNPSKVNIDHPFYRIPKFSDNLVSVYADYKYIHELFANQFSEVSELHDSDLIGFHGSKLYLTSINSFYPNHKTLHHILDWKDLDPSVLSADNATIWVGSKGAHTPLHYDSYGRNIVIQLYGHKSWSLWNPSERNMSILSPSRVPYEESSVYADVTKYDPQLPSDIQRHSPNMTLALSPGDVLYLPKYWWHYVTTESDISISMNMWIPQLQSSPSSTTTIPPTICHHHTEWTGEMSEPDDPLPTTSLTPTTISTTPTTAAAAVGGVGGAIPIGTLFPSNQITDDRWDQFTESLCRFIFGTILDGIKQSKHSIPVGERDGWYSPSESTGDEGINEIPRDLIDHDQNLTHVFTTLNRIINDNNNSNNKNLSSIYEDNEIKPEIKKRILQQLLSTILHPKSLQSIGENMIDKLNQQSER